MRQILFIIVEHGNGVEFVLWERSDQAPSCPNVIPNLTLFELTFEEALS